MWFRWFYNYLNSEPVQQKMVDSRFMRLAARSSVAVFYTIKAEIEKLKLLETLSRRSRIFLDNYKKQYRSEMKRRLGEK